MKAALLVCAVLGFTVIVGCFTSKKTPTQTFPVTTAFNGYPCDCPPDQIITIPFFADTATACKVNPWLCAYPGLVIRTTGDSLWYRSDNTKVWLYFAPKK